jgi:hypothetical protein
VNFKIRVVENVGRYSEESFGKPGNVLDVKDGLLKDLEDFIWSNNKELFGSIETINGRFGSTLAKDWRTEFELVEDNP